MSDYQSPTTPGLQITFRNYVIELVCINTSRWPLKQRFWKDKKYWGPKWGREIKGMSNLEKSLEVPFTNMQLRVSIIDCVKKLNIKSLSAKKTIEKLVRAIKKDYNSRLEDMQNVSQDENTHAENEKFTRTGNKTRLSKLLEIESGQETQN